LIDLSRCWYHWRKSRVKAEARLLARVHGQVGAACAGLAEVEKITVNAHQDVKSSNMEVASVRGTGCLVLGDGACTHAEEYGNG